MKLAIAFNIIEYKAKIELSLRQADEGKLTAFSMDELESLEAMETDDALGFMKDRQKESQQ